MPPDEALPTLAWAGDGDPGYLLRPSPDSEHFFTELREGRFVLRYCPSCGRPRYPHGPVCPYCRTTGHEWRSAVTGGTVLSWVRCHLAFVPEFAPLLPYVVLDVQMDAGVRIIGRLVSSSAVPPSAEATLVGGTDGVTDSATDSATAAESGMKVRLAAEIWPGDVAVPCFLEAAGGG